MKETTFNQKIHNTINNGETTLEELKEIEPILIENCRSSIKLMYNFYFITLVLVSVWFLIYNSIITEVKVMDVQINNKKILLFGIPLISIVVYYITMSYMTFNQLIDSALKQIQKKLYPNISNGSIMEMLIYPSLIELESIRLRLTKESFWDITQFLLISLAFVFVPIILNGIICYHLILDFYTSDLIWFPIIYSFLLIKIITNFFFILNKCNNN